MERLQRRSGGAKERNGAFETRAIHGGIASVIARDFFLLVARFLFFVDDDEAEIFERREDRGARAYYDADVSVPHAPPFAGAFDVRQGAVQHGYVFAEPRADQAADPERQRDFGNEHDGGLPAREGGLDRA